MDRVKGADKEAWKMFRNALSKQRWVVSREFTEKGVLSMSRATEKWNKSTEKQPLDFTVRISPLISVRVVSQKQSDKK